MDRSKDKKHAWVDLGGRNNKKYLLASLLLFRRRAEFESDQGRTEECMHGSNTIVWSIDYGYYRVCFFLMKKKKPGHGCTAIGNLACTKKYGSNYAAHKS